MRHIDINIVCNRLSEKVIEDLERKQKELADCDDQKKINVISGGNTTWRKTKECLENFSNRKCWYTESKNPGCLYDIDHFRPKAPKLNGSGETDYWYWFLVFDPENYRLSCQFSNRLNTNRETGETGGKGDQFPLLGSQVHAASKVDLTKENPVLLDPCCSDDCELLEFLPDGRPVVSSQYKNDKTACFRVDKTKILLNLDFPTFNEDREALYNKIKRLVERGDRYGAGNPALDDIKQDLKELMQKESQYSKAAECYIRSFRDRKWVEDIFF